MNDHLERSRDKKKFRYTCLKNVQYERPRRVQSGKSASRTVMRQFSSDFFVGLSQGSEAPAISALRASPPLSYSTGNS
jgi:hypothetical protein